MTETLQGCLREGYPHYAPPTTSATSQNTSGPNSQQLLFRSSYRLNALEGFREPILWTWEPLPCPLWPLQHPLHHRTPRGQIPNNFYFDRLTVWTPWKASGGLSYELGSRGLPCPLWPLQHPPHHRTPRGQIPNNFYFDRLTVWTPWKASGGLSYELGSPSSAPCGPNNIRHIVEHLGAKSQKTFISIVLPSERPGRLQGAYLMNLGAPPLPPVAPTTSATSQNTSGPNSKQLLFRSSFPLSSLEGYRENILFSGGPPPPFAPLWGAWEGV